MSNVPFHGMRSVIHIYNEDLLFVTLYPMNVISTILWQIIFCVGMKSVTLFCAFLDFVYTIYITLLLLDLVTSIYTSGV